MASSAGWLGDNWFLLLQGLGIVGGLLFTALSLRSATAARKVTDLLSLAEHHRELWSEMEKRSELTRILSRQVDLIAQPISLAEEQYLNAIIVHFNTGWLLARTGALLQKSDLAGDVRSFFSLPIPKAIWKESKVGRDPKFVRFVEECLQSRVDRRKA